jgi:hypothetical protein
MPCDLGVCQLLYVQDAVGRTNGPAMHRLICNAQVPAQCGLTAYDCYRPLKGLFGCIFFHTNSYIP